MAEQTANPGTWSESLSDGCSGVWDWFGSHPVCVKHDHAYFLGGTVEDKLAADDNMYAGLMVLGFPWTWGYAKLRYDGVRCLTYSYPPGHPMRSSLPKVEAFNWKGPGPL